MLTSCEVSEDAQLDFSKCKSHNAFPVQVGSHVKVFSRTANDWVNAEVVSLPSRDRIRAEYPAGGQWCAKTLALRSAHLDAQPQGHGPSQALMQGCRPESPLTPEKLYLTLDFILEMLKRGDVVLIKGSWLLKCYEEKHVLPRRQELPNEAKWDYATLETSLQDPVNGMKLISISHCWYTKAHPDPDGAQVQEVGPAIKAYLVDYPDIAVFWCWCSFFQDPRTKYEQEAFERSMRHMDLWYTNWYAEVWKLTQVPEHAINRTSYKDRGWTTWESTVAELLTREPDGGYFSSTARKPLDISLLDPEFSFDSCSVAVTCACAVAGLPTPPEVFANAIEHKCFTKGKPDLELVKANYTRNFHQVMSIVPHFVFQDIDNDVEAIKCFASEVLAFCPNVITFAMRGCQGVGDDGARALCNALRHCSDLSYLTLMRCELSDESADALIMVMQICTALNYIELGSNRFSSAIKAQLKSEADALGIEHFHL